MKFAIVGCQHSHIKIFIDEMLETGHECVGIFDPSDYYLPEAYCKQYGVPRLGSMEEALERGAELIGNCDDNERKIDVIEWCERHRLPVMTDKPIVKDFAGLRRLKDVILRGVIEIGMMLTERYEPHLYTLKHMIDRGELGDIVDYTFLKPHKLNRAQRPDWFFKKSVNGGLIVDLMIHDVDLLGWFSADRRIVAYEGKLLKTGSFPEYPEFYDNAQASLVLEGGVTANWKSDWHMPSAFDSWGDGRIFVTGTEGRAEIRSAGDVFGEPGPFLAFSTHARKATRVETLRPPRSLTEDFLEKLAGRPHLLSTDSILRCNELVLQFDAASTKWSW